MAFYREGSQLFEDLDGAGARASSCTALSINWGSSFILRALLFGVSVRGP